MKSRWNPVLIACVLLGLVCALWLNYTRHIIEKRNNTVAMAMEYEGLRKLAALEGLPEAAVLQKFKEAGINSLMIFDTTLERLSKNGVVQCATGTELRQAQLLGADLGGFAPVLRSGMLEKNAVYLAPVRDKEAFADMLEDLKLRYGEERVQTVSVLPQLVKVKGSTALVPEDKYDEPLGLLQAPLGLPSADMRRVSDAGFQVIVRPQNYTNVAEKQIDSIFARIAASGVPVAALMPCGKEVVGYPDKVAYLGAKMRQQDMQLIMLEHYTQLQFVPIDGLLPLAEAVDYCAARSYVIDGLEQKKISVDTALRRWALTDEERNIRVNYVRPFLQPREGRDLLTLNLQYVRDIVQQVQDRGYTIGEAGVFSAADGGYAPYFPAKVAFLPVAAAILAGTVLLLAQLCSLNGKKQLLLWLALTAAACAPLLLARGLLVRQLLALLAAAVFPVLSLSAVMQLWERPKGTERSGLLKILVSACWQLALAVALSLIGGLFLSAILTDSRFLLEIDIYRGVKLTFMLPVLLTALLCLRRYDVLRLAGQGGRAVWQRLQGLLDTGITFKYVAVLAVLLFVVYYFVGRSGHTGGVPVPAIELKMRALLEQLMYARPREKEFMIGHPAFFLAVYAAYKGTPRLWQFVLTVAAVIGQGSLVQTFCHMRTPVMMTVWRALDGYAVGVLFGIAAVLVLALLLPLGLKLKRRYLDS